MNAILQRLKAAMFRQRAGLLIATLVSIGGMVVGTLAGPNGQDLRLPAVIESQSSWSYFSHNIPLLALLAVGVITGGLLTLIVLGINGILEGNLLAGLHRIGALSDGLSVVLPHAPFELCAMLLAGAVGFAPVSIVYRMVLDHTVYLKSELEDAALLLIVALLLLVPASVIEAWVSPFVANWKIGGL